MSDKTWIEGTGTPNAPSASGINFSNQPASNGDELLGTGAFAGGTTGNSNYPLTASTDLLTELNNGSTANLRLTPADLNIEFTFNSRTGASSPQLIFTATVPEPHGLLLIGMAAVAFTARRKK